MSQWRIENYAFINYMDAFKVSRGRKCTMKFIRFCSNSRVINSMAGINQMHAYNLLFSHLINLFLFTSDLLNFPRIKIELSN